MRKIYEKSLILNISSNLKDLLWLQLLLIARIQKKKGYKYKKDTNKEIKINEYEVLFLILII